jgi:hypothetical protein
MAQSNVGLKVANAFGVHPERYTPPADVAGTSYVEKEPTTKEFLLEHRPTVGGFKNYMISLFPFWTWIFHYNWVWLMGDIIAGK